MSTKRPTRVGAYSPSKLLLRSYFGALWQGTDDAGRTVAIRIFDAGLTADDHDKLVKAATALKGVEAGGLVPLLDVVDEDSVGIVSEAVEGDTVRTLLRQLSVRRKSLPLGVIVRMGLDMCEGITELHARADALQEAAGVGHGGLTPDSFLTEPDGRVRLLEPGVELVVSRSNAWKHNAKRLGYDAPELLEGQSVGESADVFTVAVMLWELVTGKRLMPGASYEVVARRWRQGSLPRADAQKRVNKDDVPAALADVLDRALAVDGGERIASVAELASLLESSGTAAADTDEVAEALGGVAARTPPMRRKSHTIAGVGSPLAERPATKAAPKKVDESQDETPAAEEPEAQAKPEPQAEAKAEQKAEPKPAAKAEEDGADALADDAEDGGEQEGGDEQEGG
ncbi:MAG: protein kinase, partial [Myxococcales bacterium]|nr:protein kinase [Myxococcales bacterium]